MASLGTVQRIPQRLQPDSPGARGQKAANVPVTATNPPPSDTQTTHAAAETDRTPTHPLPPSKRSCPLPWLLPSCPATARAASGQQASLAALDFPSRQLNSHALAEADTHGCLPSSDADPRPSAAGPAVKAGPDPPHADPALQESLSQVRLESSTSQRHRPNANYNVVRRWQPSAVQTPLSGR